MAKTEVRVEGLSELGRRLNSLKADVAGRIALGATSAGARVIQKEAKQRVPVRTGAVQKDIVVKREKNSSLAAEYAVGFKKAKKADANGPKDGWYGRLVEFGTVKMAPRPFLRPAFESKKQAAVDKMAEVLGKRIKKAGA